MSETTTNGVHSAATNGTCRQACQMSLSTPIAIIGMSCKFAGDVSSPSKLWDLIAAGKDGWSPIPKDRFDAASLYHPDQQRTDRHHIQGGYFLDGDVTVFDAPFFSVSAEAASAMDPQLRLSMEGVYEAVENAGIPIEKLAGTNTSVFSGTFGRDYTDRLVKDPESLPASYFTGNGAAMYSNRISYFFDLKGPSVTTDTGCSGSMAALHMAAQTIRTGESDISIVAVAQFMLNPDLYIALSNLGVLGPSGKCYSWDHRANGYGRGEGMAVVVLKRLSDALRDGDYVHSVIRESFMNQDGKTSTITSPSMEAQEQLIEECYARAGLKLCDTVYVEAHMTGTPTGDPIEAKSLAQTFGKSRAPGDAVYVGSIKPNIGHTEPVSGLASIIKTALVLQKQLIPPHMNYEKPNPAIPLEDWNLQVANSLIPWPQGMPLRASVNNFGYGGTNVHVIMEALLSTTATSGTSNISGINGVKTNQIFPCSDPPSYVYVVSSKHLTGTLEMNRKLSAYIRDSISQAKEPRPVDLAYTLAQRRSRFPCATAVRATSLGELAGRLEEPHRKATRASQNSLRIGFVFNGQGAQWYAMGRELLSTYPVFGSAIRKGDQVLQQKYGAPWSLHEEELLRDENSSRINDADISQPVNVAVQLGLVDLLKSWNITPSAVVSHSSGEIAAAYAAGVLSFEEALGVVYYRGQLALKHQKLATLSGGMIAVRLSVEEADEYIRNLSSGNVVVACVNSPSSVTLSGDLDALEEVALRLEDDAVSARKLEVPLAYHSHHIQHMAQEYQSILETILPPIKRELRTLFSSPTTGDIVASAETLDSKHWVRNLTKPVLFSKALEEMVFSSNTPNNLPRSQAQATNVDVLLEIGAHNTLSGPVRETLCSSSLPYLSCLKRYANAVSTMQDVACDLLVRGYPVSLTEVNSVSSHNPRYVHDLPSYVWDHSSRFLVEPRVSRENRYRRFLPHELLGSPVPGTSKLTPTWRNFLRVHDIPWLVDHQLESKIVFPGAGYISMAIEAVRRLRTSTGAKETPSAYRIRDVVIMNALMIPTDTTGAEIVFTLRDCNEKELDHRDWYEFELCSVTRDDSWIRHCTGYVLAETATTKQKSITKAEDRRPGLESFFHPEVQVNDVEPDSTFACMRKMGIYHGPAFQNLIGSKVAGERSITDFNMSPEALDKDDEYVLHPTTLDSIFQTCYFSLPPKSKEGGMLVPHSIGSLSIPGRLGRHAGHKLQSFVEFLGLASRKAAFSGSVFPDADDGESGVPLHMHNISLQRVQPAEDEGLQRVSRVHSQGQWELDVLHDIPATVRGSMQIWLDDDELAYEKRLREAAYHLMVDAIAQLQKDNSGAWQDYHKRYHSWMKTVVDAIEKGQLTHAAALGCKAWAQRSQSAKKCILDNLAAENAGGELLCRIGRQLAQIIRGDVHPLELMMESGLLHKYYTELPQFANCYKQLRRVIELYAAKEPGAKVLEIGAGTGGATVHVLEAFGAKAAGGTCGSVVGHYDFTDISADFFVAARHKFAAWEDKMSFAKLDIEFDPIPQGFASGSYDLIIASQVLHATKSLDNTLLNARKLLKPRGKLVMLEGTQHSIDLELIFGTLPGWWLGQETKRQMSAIADIHTWNELLKANGFSGVDVAIGNCEQPETQVSSVIVSTAVAAKLLYPSSISVVKGHNTPKEFLDDLAKAIQAKTGTVPDIESFEEVQAKHDTLYLVTVEINYPLVGTMDRATFEKVRSLLVNSMGIFWIGCGGAVDAQRPLWAETTGLLRTFRREDQNKRCIQLDFQVTSDPWARDKISHIMHVFEESFDYNIANSNRNMDWEYAVKDSMLHVPRLYPDVAQDRACSGSTPAAEPRAWHKRGKDLVVFQESINFAEVPEMADSVPRGMVEVETKAFGLNFQDVMLATGLVQDVLIRTHEAAGIVKRLGPGTEQSGLRVGDRVCGAFRGGFASTSRAWWTNIIQIPTDVKMSWEEAAAFPTAYLTAHVSFCHIARLEPRERILIHSAAGGVGQAAIMLAQHIGAEIFVTCGTEEKRRLLMERYNIPEDHIFNSRDASFASGVMAQTNGQGVDVVLNSLAGPLLKATWECIARFGRFVEIGKVDFHAAKRLDMTPFGRNVSLAGVDLVQYSELKGMVIHDALVDLMSLYRCGQIKSLYPITPFSISDMEEAMEQMQTGLHMGKLVLAIKPDDIVNVVPRAPSLDLTIMDITHLIVGGLRGVGHAIALWMMENGAKHMLCVSRNALSHPNLPALQKKAKKHGCTLVVRNCDVADEKGFLELLESVKKLNLPPVRGVLQAAMVLDDTVLERMTYEQWQTAVHPKVAGTLNICNHLPDLSYLVMLSSGTAITGNVSQANYAAGNTFQDALARHRTANGQPAVAINLGPVDDVGYVAERGEDVLKRVDKAVTSITLSVDHVTRLVESAIVNPLRKTVDQSQIITCFPRYEALPEDQGLRNDKRFGTLRLGDEGARPSQNANGASSISRVDELTRELARTGPSIGGPKAVELATALLAAEIGELFRVDPADIDVSMPLTHHGVDSLVAVRFRNWLSSEVRARVTIFEILQSHSLTEFAALVAARSGLVANVS